MIAKQRKLKHKYAQIYQRQEMNLSVELETVRANHMHDESEQRNRWYAHRGRKGRNGRKGRTYAFVRVPIVPTHTLCITISSLLLIVRVLRIIIRRYTYLPTYTYK